MKKVLITLALVFCTIAANAQFVLGVDASVNMQNTNSQTNFSRYIITGTDLHDTNYTLYNSKVKGMGYGIGINAGYQFGRVRVGLGVGYQSNSSTTYEFCDTIVDYDVWEKTTQTALYGKLYFRYDFVQIGDISVFAQLDAKFTSMPAPKVRQYTNRIPIPGSESFTSHDTTFTIPVKTTMFDISVVPGISWQISPICSLDLYIDLLKLGYQSTKVVRTLQTPSMLDPEKTDVAETVSKDGLFYFGCDMTAKTLLDDLSLFRLGFNLTF